MNSKAAMSLMLVALIQVALLGSPILADDALPDPLIVDHRLKMSSKLTLRPTGSPPILATSAPVSTAPVLSPSPTASGSSKFVLIVAALGLGALLGGGLGRHLGWRRGFNQGQVNADDQVSDLRQTLATTKEQFEATNANKSAAPAKHHGRNKAIKNSEAAAANVTAQWQTTISTFERDVRDKNSLIDQLRDKLSATESKKNALSQDINDSTADHKKTLEVLHSEHSAALAAKEQDLTQQIETLEQSHDTALSELSEQHAQALAAQHSENERLLTDHQATLESLRSEHRAALTSKERDLTQQNEALKQSSEATIVELTAQHTEAMAAQLSENERLLAEQQNVLETFRAEHAQELATKEQSLTQQSSTLKKSRDAAVAELTGQHAKAIEAQRSENERLQQEYSQAIEAQRQEHERLLADHQDALKTLRSEHGDALAAKDQNLTQQSEELEQLREATTAELNAQHGAAIDAQRIENRRLMEEHKSLSEDLEQARLAQRTLETQLITTHETNTKTEQEIIRLTALAEQYNTQQEELTAALTAAESTNEELATNLAAAKKQANETSFKKDAAMTPLQKQIDILQNELVTRDNDTRALVAELTTLRQQTADNSDLKATLAKRDKALAHAQAKLAKLDDTTSELAELTGRFNLLDQQAQLDAAERREANDHLLELADVIENHDSLQIEHNKLIGERDRLASTLKELEASGAASTTSIEALQRSSNDLEQQLSQALAREKSSTKKREALQQQVNELHNAAKDKTDAVSQLDQTVIMLKSERDEIAQQLSKSEILLEETTSNHARMVDELMRQSSDLEAEIGRLTTQHKHVEQEAAVAHGKLEKITSQLATRDNRLRDLSKERKANGVALKKALADSEAATKMANDLNTLVSKLESKLKDQSEQTSAHQAVDQRAQEEHKKELDKLTDQLATRDRRLEELAQEQEYKEAALETALAENEATNKTSTELTAHIRELETRLKEQTEQSSAHVALGQSARDKHNQQLDQMERAMNDASNRSHDLETQIEALREELDSRKAHSVELNAELIDLRADREAQRRNIVDLHARLHKEHDGDIQAELDEVHATLEQRNKLIGTLENQLNRAVRFAEELQESIENMRLETVAEEHKSERNKDNSAEPEQISKELVGRMQKQMKAQIARIRKLENDVKVHSDLVKVLESDSTQLHNAERRLEEIAETAEFLQHELTGAVTENRMLREQLEQNAKQLARHQNIGRTLSNETIEHQKPS